MQLIVDNMVTGNEYVSLPEIRGSDGAIGTLTFLHMALKGMVIIGEECCPLIRPVALDGTGRELAIESIEWEREGHWVPRFRAHLEGGADTLVGTLLAPVGERGFAVRLQAEPAAGAAAAGASRIAALALRGRAKAAGHLVNETRPLGRGLAARPSEWNGAFVIDLVADLPVFSFAPMPSPGMEVSWKNGDGEMGGAEFELRMDVSRASDRSATFFWGLGFEEVGAVTAAKELQRKGWDRLHSGTLSWLGSRERSVGDPALDATLNRNLFFNFFFASGMTLDTEEFVLVTSRSPRYYVSASYWDRDSLLWSFPAILAVDRARALEMLLYAFGRQIRNAGIHSRYIDGTVLEPGFELDELVAPLLALDAYARASGDPGIALREPFAGGIGRILATLETKLDAELGLYETFLQPTDDPAPLPYLTYDNVLVWKALTRLAALYSAAGLPADALMLEARAASLRGAVMARCVRKIDGAELFVWAVDRDGGYVVYDEPPGSLELLAWHGFIAPGDPVYAATVARIRDPEYPYSFAGRAVDEIGCGHAPQPWILSLANSLLCGRREKARRLLSWIPMDDGIACESVDADTGRVASGGAFATCAGFLSFAMLEGFGGGR